MAVTSPIQTPGRLLHLATRDGLRLGVLASYDPDLAMLIDVHAHFYHDRTPRADWRERNASRLEAGRKIGITIHVASILGSFGRTSPTYFPSPPDLEYGNDALLALAHDHPDAVQYGCHERRLGGSNPQGQGEFSRTISGPGAARA